MFPQDAGGIKRYVQSLHVTMVHLWKWRSVTVWRPGPTGHFLWRREILVLAYIGFFKKCMEMMQVCYMYVHASQGVRQSNSPTHKHPQRHFGITQACSGSFVFTLWMFNFEGLKLLVWLPSLKKKDKKKHTHEMCVCVSSPACPEFCLILVHLSELSPRWTCEDICWDLKRCIEGNISVMLS